MSSSGHMALACLLVLFLGTGLAGAADKAQDDGLAFEKQAEKPRPPGWLLPAPDVQAQMASELIPMNKGAIFVPAMSESAAEPPVQVRRVDGTAVLNSPTGELMIVDPGRYTVMVGSGVESQMTLHDVEVHEGRPTVLEPKWSGLLVRVVDERGAPFRGAYEIFALPSGEDFGIGLGADVTKGETLRTWLLPPGRYMIVRSGETPRARTDFVTVRLLPGELVHFTLVFNEKEGLLRGGGVVPRWEGKTEIENWRIGLRVGGDVLWNRNDHVPGREFGNTFTFSSFMDGSVRYLDPDHLAYGRLQMDVGATLLPSSDFAELQKTIDELDFDAIYTYRILSWLGPYVRLGLNTNLFPGQRFFKDMEQDVVVLDQGLNEVDRLQRPSSLQLADAFDPVEIKEGMGVSFDLSPSLLFDVHLRVGFGARQTLVRSLLIERESSEPSPTCEEAMCFMRGRSSNQLGAEATLIGSARLVRWLMIDTELDTLIPFYSSDASSEPVINWRNTISLRLVWFASLAYVVKLDYNKQLSDYLQFEQRLLLRFTFDIL